VTERRNFVQIKQNMIRDPLFHDFSKEVQIPNSPKLLEVVRISKKRFKSLNEEWHSKLPICTNCWNGLCYSAEYKNISFAVAWWSHPIAQNRLKNGYNIYELRRMAICDEAPKNTASYFISKMIKYIKKEKPNIYKLISYQDTSVHLGTIYKASGWEKVETQKNGFQTWKNRNHRNDLSTGVKIRWEKQIRSLNRANNFNKDCEFTDITDERSSAHFDRFVAGDR
jgi:hypothetical protein